MHKPFVHLLVFQYTCVLALGAVGLQKANSASSDGFA